MSRRFLTLAMLIASGYLSWPVQALTVEECATARPSVLAPVAPRGRVFGADAATQSVIARLIARGEKSVTFHLAMLENVLGDIPDPGTQHSVLDGEGAIQAIIETTAVRRLPFSAVTENETRYEGPAARSLENWRRIHQAFWQPSLEARGRVLRDGSEVVVEYFRLVCGAGGGAPQSLAEPAAGGMP